jgi:hypothetical protein
MARTRFFQNLEDWRAERRGQRRKTPRRNPRFNARTTIRVALQVAIDGCERSDLAEEYRRVLTDIDRGVIRIQCGDE